MKFEVRAVPEGIYDAYLDLRQKVNRAPDSHTHRLMRLSAVGAADPSCGELCAPLATTTYPLNTDRTVKAASEPPAGGN